MPRSEPSEKLVDLIYSSAGDPDLWPRAMQEIANDLQAPGGILFGKSVAIGSVRSVIFDHNGGLDEGCNLAYRSRHLANAWSDYMTGQPAGRVVSSDQIVSLRALKRTPFYDEVLKPQNVAHSAMMALAKREDFLVAFNICRSAKEGPFQEKEREWISRLVPHLRRSLLLGHRFAGYQELRRGEWSVLDRVGVGVVVLDQQGYVAYVNARARSLSSGTGALRLRREGLATHSPALTSYVQSAIRSVLRGAPIASASVPHSDGSGALHLTIVSLRSGDTGALSDAGMRDAVALMFVVAAGEQVLPTLTLTELFGLTTAEARVAALVSEGKSVSETAQRLALSPNTVKTHLQRVYAKIGATRQSELAAKLAPFRSFITK